MALPLSVQEMAGSVGRSILQRNLPLRGTRRCRPGEDQGMALAAEHPFTGACILNWNAGDALAGCVASAKQALDGLPHRIVVVDNFSNDGSLAQLPLDDPDLTIIRNRENTGYSRGNNTGARYLLELGCDALVIVNPDVRLDRLSVRRCLEALFANDRTGCVGCSLIGPGGARFTGVRRRPTPLQRVLAYSVFRRLPGLRSVLRGHTVPLTELRECAPVYSVSGACLFLRAQAFREIGGFDEATFLYQEEFILAERLSAAGWRTLYEPLATYFHEGGRSTRQIPYRHRAHFIDAEYHLCTVYYRWPRPAARLLQGLRYAELGLYWMARRSGFYRD
jgi:N-acetylglucosaminyl-diphospho-decaprenol L-rhamnosyltransferase